MENLNHITANWHAPAQINAITTYRTLGFSTTPFEQNNLALHVGDDANRVELNRNQLKKAYQLLKEPIWLNQVHSNYCVLVDQENNRTADAAITRQTDLPLAILTADCLPILLCNHSGNEIAAIHAGWKGLGNGVIENTLSKMLSEPAKLLAWIGPGICQNCFEVGEEVFQYYQESNYTFSRETFLRKKNRWHANLAKLAEEILHHWGVKAVFQSQACTFEQENCFYSYRRNAQTGRMATLIWINSQPLEDIHD